MGRLAIRNFVVGLFVLAGLGSIAYLSLSVGGLTLGGSDGITIYAHFDDISGLKPMAKVTVAGVKVGQVVNIDLDDDYRAQVQMNLDDALEYPQDTSASIITAGILGDKYVELQIGGDDRLLLEGDTITFTESALILERLIGKLIHNTDVSVGDGN